MRPIGAHGGRVMYFGSFCFRGELSFLKCDDVCMCVVNKLFQLIEFVLNSVYIDLQYNEIYLSYTVEFVCSHVVVLGQSMRLS